jgi:hypothetical protein
LDHATDKLDIYGALDLASTAREVQKNETNVFPVPGMEYKLSGPDLLAEVGRTEQRFPQLHLIRPGLLPPVA